MTVFCTNMCVSLRVRDNNVLDLVFSSEEEIIQDLTVRLREPLGNCDHYVVSFNVIAPKFNDNKEPGKD